MRKGGCRGVWLATAVLGFFAAVAMAQPPASSSAATVTFQFQRKGLPVPEFTLVIRADGSGSYDAEDASNGTPVPVHRELFLSREMATRIFKLAAATPLSPAVCASKAKNIADTGTKTLTLAAAGVASSCTYNFTENKDVSALTTIFQGIAETLDQGRRLDYLHRFDRLGLDEAMTFLTDEAASGRALELEAIAPSLRSVAEDPEVMERVRTRAKTLLATASRNPAE